MAARPRSAVERLAPLPGSSPRKAPQADPVQGELGEMRTLPNSRCSPQRAVRLWPRLSPCPTCRRGEAAYTGFVRSTQAPGPSSANGAVDACSTCERPRVAWGARATPWWSADGASVGSCALPEGWFLDRPSGATAAGQRRRLSSGVRGAGHRPVAFGGFLGHTTASPDRWSTSALGYLVVGLFRIFSCGRAELSLTGSRAACS